MNNNENKIKDNNKKKIDEIAEILKELYKLEDKYFNSLKIKSNE